MSLLVADDFKVLYFGFNGGWFFLVDVGLGVINLFLEVFSFLL
jgi:hypothetical protein